MIVEIFFGWWLIPTALTIAAFVRARALNERENPNGNYGTYGVGAFYALIVYGGALIFSLVAWLVWSLLT